MIKYKIAKYDAYKDSEVSWQKKIPYHWRMERVKNLTKTQSGTTPRSEVSEYYENGTNFWVRTTDLNNDRLYSSEYKITNIALKHCGLKTIPVNSILLAMYGGMGTIGKNSILKEKVTINQSVCAILPNDKSFNSTYLWYYVQYFRSHWEMFADSARKDPNINQEAIKRLWVIAPPLPEQKAIANYLDTKTAQIDYKIDLLTQKASKYNELKQSLINETVTRGLDKTVALKDSGVEWIGKVPEHWEVKRLKDLGTIETSSVDKKIKSNEKLVKLVNYKNIYDNLIKEIWNQDDYMEVSANNKQLQDKQLMKGDVLFTPSSETIEDIGVSAVVKENLYNTLYSYHILRLRFNISIHINFKKYLFNNKNVQYYFSKSSKGTTRKILGLNSFYNLEMPIPPTHKEQQAIANYLDTKTNHIDSIIETINIQIDKLKELRKTLINDVVTGKINITMKGEAV